MDRPKTLNLLRMAHNEIITLRRVRDELAPKAHAYETLALFARLSQPDERSTYSEDAAWRLKVACEALEAEREAERSETDVAGD